MPHVRHRISEPTDRSGAAVAGRKLAGLPSRSLDAIAVSTPEDGESGVTVLYEDDQQYVITVSRSPRSGPRSRPPAISCSKR
jgi:hypothetical protein